MKTHEIDSCIDELQTIWDALVRREDIPETADAIVVGGCSDTGLADRAAELYHLGVSDLIVVSGYKPEKLEITEAEFLANRCMELGVPKENIVLEKEASNTGANILLSAEIINKLKPEAKSVVLVHKPFMSLRFLATAEAQWPSPQPKLYTTCEGVSFEEYCRNGRGLEAVAWEMLGDFKRMDEYVEKGYQTQQYIPEAAREAFERVVSGGFVTR